MAESADAHFRFTGSSGTAVVSMTEAFLFTDSRYWIQASRELDVNWILMKVGSERVKNWNEWIIVSVGILCQSLEFVWVILTPIIKDRAGGIRVGIDSRMVSLEVSNKINSALTARASSLVFPWQNLVDLIWKDRPLRPKDLIYVQPMQFAGVDAREKLVQIRSWIGSSTPLTERYSTNPPKPKDIPIAAFLADLADIAWTLNLRGSDIPFTPVFMSYLFVTMDSAILFIENGKISEEVREYLQEIGVSTKEYSEVWPFLRSKDWGTGKVRSQN